LLGELKARQVMDFWATDHYTWIYKTVVNRQDIDAYEDQKITAKTSCQY
jgi:hypothetical protein